MSQAPDGYDEDSGPEDLPATAYAVLGILTINDEELSAGEIKTRASFGIRYFYWSPAVSHIRRELRRLLELGLVEEREITLGRVRRSQVYRTTQAGDEALARWVSDRSPDEPVVVKNSVLLRVFLGSKAPLDTVLSVLDSRMAQVDESIAELNWGMRRGRELNLTGQERLRFTRAVAEYSLRALHFERGNLQQLRDTVAGFDTEGFREDTSRSRGPWRRRGSPGPG
jgi:DNA-binding PadR family transcriptional regulator